MVEKGVLRVVRVGVEVGERRCAGRDGRDAGAVVGFGWKVEAAARVTPRDERRGARRKAEENSVLVCGDLGGKFWVVADLYSKWYTLHWTLKRMIWNVVVQACYFELILLRKISQSSNRNIKVSYLLYLIRSLGCRDLERHLIGLSWCMIPKQIASNI